MAVRYLGLDQQYSLVYHLLICHSRSRLTRSKNLKSMDFFIRIMIILRNFNVFYSHFTIAIVAGSDISNEDDEIGDDDPVESHATLLAAFKPIVDELFDLRRDPPAGLANCDYFLCGDW